MSKVDSLMLTSGRAAALDQQIAFDTSNPSHSPRIIYRLLEKNIKYFEKFYDLLSDRGVALLHSIGLEEDPALPQDPWIAKYIFPGSRLPRLEEICREARLASLAVGHMENFRPHYAITLRHWRENFIKNWPKIQKIDSRYDTRFFRLWNYYLQMCEACFINSTMELYQVLLCKRKSWNFPLQFNFAS